MHKQWELPAISKDSHKYERGSLLILAGSLRFYGAGVLATLAAEKGGVGYATLATPACAAPAVRTHLLCSPVIEAPDNPLEGSFAPKALELIVEQLRHIDAVCCGCGLTVSSGTLELLNELLQLCLSKKIPLLLDADALNIIARKPELLSPRLQYENTSKQASTMKELNPLVLSPHEGELKRLATAFELPDSLQEDKKACAYALAQMLHAVVVAKGSCTIVASSSQVIECCEATPALAKSGTGDVLAGLIASLMAQGMQEEVAALAGVQIHSKAGCLAEEKLGQRSVSALDVIAALPQAIQAFES